MAGESALFRLRERPPTPAVRAFELPPRMQPMLDRAKTDLAEPFRGIITDGGIVPELFTIEKSGVSLVPLLEATRSFLVSLSAEQRKAACFAIDDEAWRQWSNIHPWLMRHGICLTDLDGNQREAALALMREAMSTAGYQTARDVMRLNEHALEITGKPEEYGQWFYWFSIFGTPSPEQPWGWQIDGHHLNVNCFVLGDQLVLTPIFMGSEPILARFGKHQGTRVFAAEEEQGYVLMRALDRFRDALVIRADHLAQVLGIDPRGQGCRADEVAEHHGELTALRANGAGRTRNRFWRNRLRERLAAAAAELSGGLVVETASRTGAGERSPAPGAKAPGRHILGRAAQAAHLAPPDADRCRFNIAERRSPLKSRAYRHRMGSSAPLGETQATSAGCRASIPTTSAIGIGHCIGKSCPPCGAEFGWFTF